MSENNVELVCCIIRKIDRNRTKTGSPFLIFQLQDINGKVMDAKRWDASDAESSLAEGDTINIEGIWNEYQGNKYVNVKTIEMGVDIDKNLFLPRISDAELADGTAELFSWIKNIQHEEYKQLLEFVFNDNFVKRFIHVPASSKVHHAVVGGLLQHTMEVLHIAVANVNVLARFKFDKELVVAGCLLHDIGKVHTHAAENGVIKTLDYEYLCGHSSKGMEIVGYAEIALSKSPNHYRWIKHIIASHHGNREWGALEEPSTREAMIVHYADLLSSRIDLFNDLNGTDGKVWQKYLNRYIFEVK